MIICLHGEASSFKSGLAKHLSDKYNFEETSFARELYGILKYSCEVLGIPYEKDREFLTFVGEWGRRKTNNRGWINHVEGYIQNNRNSLITISDGRHTEELKFCEENGIIVIHINRTLEEDERAKPFRNHVSEVEARLQENKKYYDFVIDNDGTTEDAFEAIDSIMHMIQTNPPYEIQQKLQIQRGKKMGLNEIDTDIQHMYN